MENNTAEIVNDWYERLMFGRRVLHFDKIGFFNFGYWKGIEESVEVAQINFLEKLISFLSNKDGNILDVACGKGATSKFLTKYFDPGNIMGINISDRQLEICRLFAPECEFKLMDATKLDFGNASFHNVLCIDSAVHFRTRQAFFEEAYRVLKPGGRLAVSDFLYDRYLLGHLGPSHPDENYLPSLDAYRQSLLGVGFKYVRIEDSTEFGYKALQRFINKQMEREFEKKRDYTLLEGAAKGMQMLDKHLIATCIAYAIK